MAFTASAIQDLVNFTRGDEGAGKLQQIAQQYTHYPIAGTMFKGDRLKTESGYRIERNLMTTIPDSARMVGLFADDQVVVQDLSKKILVEFRQATTNWGFDESEIDDNSGAARIYDLMKERRAGAELAMIELLEQKAWSTPGSSSDNLEFYGIPYWIVKNATTGFTGGAPSGHTTVGNIDPAAVPTFKNYSVVYEDINKADLLAKLRTAMRKCSFKEVTDLEGYRKMKDTYRLYVNEDTIVAIETIGESQNENLGRDLAPFDGSPGRGLTGVAEMEGQLTFRRKPIIWAPRLDSDTENPVYGIDHSTFSFHVKKQCDMKESPPLRVANKHRVWAVHKDLRGNFVCVDRRRNFVAYDTA